MVNFIPHYTNETLLLCAQWDLRERIKVVTWKWNINNPPCGRSPWRWTLMIPNSWYSHCVIPSPLSVSYIYWLTSTNKIGQWHITSKIRLQNDKGVISFSWQKSGYPDPPGRELNWAYKANPPQVQPGEDGSPRLHYDKQPCPEKEHPAKLYGRFLIHIKWHNKWPLF